MEQLEDQLRQQAQILGDLNLELNKFVEQNQALSGSIVQLEARIAKKKKQIDQETKDKNLIHQKLVAAEKQKQELELDMQDQQFEEMQQVSEKKVSKPQPVQEEIKRPEALNKVKKIQKEQQSPKSKQESPKKYENSQKGDYEPPLLFLPDQNKSNSDSSNQEEGDGHELLSSIQQKLASLKDVGDNEDDD